MASLNADRDLTGGAVSSASSWWIALKPRYVVTIGFSSFLLFLIEPMIARMALPRLGGAPAVWNSAMLVYQFLLLAGYTYAHWLGRLSGHKQKIVHVGALACAALLLPLGLTGATPPANASAFVWVPWLLMTSIGPIFFVIAAQAPLLQRWFADAGGGNPYHLYAASNLGSFGGLLAYPLIVEPILTLKEQSQFWTVGYCAMALLVAACAMSVPRNPTVRSNSKVVAPPTSRRTMMNWLLLASVPSGLMLSTTTHITSDIVAMPLLWVIPLGLYILSFSVAFAENRKIAERVSSIAGLAILIGGGSAFAASASQPMLYSLIGLGFLFVISVTLHTMLYDNRPEESRLTGFYMVMSLGGVVGGVFCALVAPLIFDWGYEHAILIICAAVIVPQRPIFQKLGDFWAESSHAHRVTIVLIFLAVPFSALGEFGLANHQAGARGLAAIALALVAICSLGRRNLFAMTLGALMLTLGGWDTIRVSLTPDARLRSYFGVNTVGTNPDNSRYLTHGTTLHGVQLLTPGHETDATAYYGPNSGAGKIFTVLPQVLGPNARVGVVGLGAGVLACYGRPGQDWRFFEIDPAVAAIARNTKQFTFLSRCAPRAPVMIGDARLLLADDAGLTLDLLTVDAFSADTIPVHLLTKEAFELYAKRLAPKGVLLINISSRFMDLEPVISAEQSAGWHGIVLEDRTMDANRFRHYTPSVWVALSRDPQTISSITSLDKTGGWRRLKSKTGFRIWTDDYASVLPLIWFNRL
jgi:hypothetical protein